MNQLPSEIKVGNVVYRIQREKHEGFKGLHMYEPGDLRIIIDPRLEGEELINVFYHELIHAILYQIGADEECENEMLVQGMANELQKLFVLKNLGGQVNDDEKKCNFFSSSNTGLICDNCGKHASTHLYYYLNGTAQ